MPENIYTDMLKRNNKDLPHVDLYVCGFPCQAFSTSGLRLGTKDPRAKIIPKMLDTISKSKPKICILENVKGFINIEAGEPVKLLLKTLEKIGYNVHHSLYNTKNYGIPQNRERIYFVCIRKDLQKKIFEKPREVKMKAFEDILIDDRVHDKPVSKMYNKNFHKIKSNTKIITPYNYYTPYQDISPTLDTACSYFFIIKQNRVLYEKEALQLQGFRKNFKQVVSRNQMMKQVGNSMSVNVVKKIIKEALLCI